MPASLSASAVSPRSFRLHLGLLALLVAAACTDDVASPGDDVPALKGGAAGAGAGAAGAGPIAGSAGSGAESGAGGGSAGTGGTGGTGGAGDSGAGGNEAAGNEAGGSDGGGSGGSAAGAGGASGGGGTTSTTTVPAGLCPVVFRSTVSGNVVVAGEWNGFQQDTATALVKQADGSVAATVNLAPGLVAYKLIVDGDYRLDLEQGRRKYVDGLENSAVLVHDCDQPSLHSAKTTATAAGAFTAELDYLAPVHGPGASEKVGAVTGTLTHEGTSRPLTPQELTVDANGVIRVAIAGLAKGKYTARVTPKAAGAAGVSGEPLRLPFWIEEKSFDWKDATIYMIMTDRFRNGDPKNDGGPLGAEPRGEFQGGDLQGVTAAIADGTLDKLGVRALWLTPFQTNPSKAYFAADNFHKVTGYHGYWPIKAREVDPRLGGEAALRAMVAEAHRHGIRILQDFVINHVHEDHEYVAAHPEWFRTGCVCGTDNCDWTTHALDCKFTAYLPDVNHTVPEANQAFVDDAVFWLDSFDLDGLRVDAVKHVEEVATRNVSAAVREGFATANARPFLMGETAMGWNDCADPCNDENYGTISKYIGPQGLDGQFDFVLYHGVSYRTFAYGDKGMLHADYWVKHGLEKWPQDAIMTPYIGSHDTPRFTSLADYRGQDGAHDRGVPNNQWDNPAVAPSSSDDEPYARTRLGLAWLLGLPGAPLLYYGDEYADWGGSDPNNRRMMRAEGELSGKEKETLAFVRKVGSARQEIDALRRGDYVSLVGTTEDTLVFGRKLDGGKSAIVGLTRSGLPQAVMVDGGSLGFASGQVLTDRISGAKVTVGADGKVVVTLAAKSAAILAP
jgi:neopullulanase